MKIVGVQVAKAQTIQWNGKNISTGIFKELVNGPIFVDGVNLEGDEQGDLTVHGGPYKAVYSYASEFYKFWFEQRQQNLKFGMFGENLTTEGLVESKVCVGDRFRMGNVLLEASQPRFPCFKLGIRFSDSRIIDQFHHSGRWGLYYRVLESGTLQAGDVIHWEFRHPDQVSIYDLYRLRRGLDKNPDKLKKIAEMDFIDPSWRAWAAKLIGSVDNR